MEGLSSAEPFPESGEPGLNRRCSIRRTTTIAADDEPVLVRLRDLRLERLRNFGDVWLAWGLWRLLEFDALLDRPDARRTRSDPLASDGRDLHDRSLLRAIK